MIIAAMLFLYATSATAVFSMFIYEAKKKECDLTLLDLLIVFFAVLVPLLNTFFAFWLLWPKFESWAEKKVVIKGKASKDSAG